jgi:hypothetical protein
MLKQQNISAHRHGHPTLGNDLMPKQQMISKRFCAQTLPWMTQTTLWMTTSTHGMSVAAQKMTPTMQRNTLMHKQPSISTPWRVLPVLCLASSVSCPKSAVGGSPAKEWFTLASEDASAAFKSPKAT